jgi:SAM-dependent methyltransferase
MRADLIERVNSTGFFEVGDLDEVTRIVFDEGTAPGGAYGHFKDAHMRLPSWFRRDLDPYGSEYASQQQQLWRLISGSDRDYIVEVDEKEAPLPKVDAVRSPGYFIRRDPNAVQAASDHVIAMGMILKHSNVAPGDWAMEYGAGFGQAALSMARLGVNVDTVDVSAAFCQWVQQQADFFQVQLTPHIGRFGINPRPGQRYKLVWFYESFHHCLDWQNLLKALPGLLEKDGRVLLCGEPIVEREYAAVPYPWGLRLHTDVVATIRRWRWFELGFSEDFLYEIFTHHGFVIRKHRCEPSLWGLTYVCERRSREVHLGQTWLPPQLEAQGWYQAESDGRQTRSTARLALDGDDEVAKLELDLVNRNASSINVTVAAGDWAETLVLVPGEHRTITWTRNKARWLELRSEGRRSSFFGSAPLVQEGGKDPGVFVRRLRYVTR